MPSVNGHEFVRESLGDSVYRCADADGEDVFTALVSTLVGRWCPSCRRFIDGPYAGRTFDVAPWEGGALVGVEDA